MRILGIAAEEPDYFINTLYSTNITDPILIIDDMSYSGSQMSNMMSKIYKDCVPKYTTDEAVKRATPDIHLLLYGLIRLQQVAFYQDELPVFSPVLILC